MEDEGQKHDEMDAEKGSKLVQIPWTRTRVAFNKALNLIEDN